MNFRKIRRLIEVNGLALIAFSLIIRPPVVILLFLLIRAGEAAVKLDDRLPGMKRPPEW